MFIVFEGPKYTGKGLLVDKLYKELHNKYKVYFTKEPGGTPSGRVIRELLNDKSYKLNDKCIALLEAADRAQHCEKIQKLLDKDYTVISKGFKEYSFVNSGYVKGNSPLAYNLNHVATSGLKQDLTVLVICDPKEAFTRFKDDSISKDEYVKSYRGYLELYEEGINSGEDWIILDTTDLTIDESFEFLMERFKPYMVNLVEKEK